MITGASSADIAVLIIDAQEGLKEQTKKHAYLLHVPQLGFVLHNSTLNSRHPKAQIFSCSNAKFPKPVIQKVLMYHACGQFIQCCLKAAYL